MITYKDRAFCASPKCKNDCGRKLTESDKAEAKRLGMPISFGFFCDDDGKCKHSKLKEDPK